MSVYDSLKFLFYLGVYGTGTSAKFCTGIRIDQSKKRVPFIFCVRIVVIRFLTFVPVRVKLLEKMIL